MPRNATELDPGNLRDALQVLGATRVEATLLAALQQKGALGTKDIVDQTGLRQPEVSVGMRTFRERGWIEAETMARSGKGRPMHRYHLTAKGTEIRSFYEAQGKEVMERHKKAIATLRSGF